MRNRLREQHKKADMIKLKKGLLNDSLNLETGWGGGNEKDFFDD